MIFKLSHVIIIFFLPILISCQQPQKSNLGTVTPAELKHGWTVFSGPRATIARNVDLNSEERGQKLFLAHCLSCHGVDGKGNGPRAASLKVRPADLTIFSKKHVSSYIYFQINEGQGEMPKWIDQLTSRETWDLSQYVRSLQVK